MSNYYKNLSNKKKAYFSILSNEFPEWLHEYIEIKELQRLSGVSMLCGTDYSPIFNYAETNSTLDHSVGVALIIWNFTHNKKQTISGLLHDIATPTFKHCIDFMNGDSEKQESTEEKTEEIIRNSKQLMALLNRDNIRVEEVCDYHIYPIADNDTPKLSADRLEYTFSNGLFSFNTWCLRQIEEYYNDISVLKNEQGISELGFNTKYICKDFLLSSLLTFVNYDNDNNRTVMQFWADIVKSMNVKGYITVDDLYKMSEQDIVMLIENCDDKYIKDIFNKFKNTKYIFTSDIPVSDKYCISVKSKKRYIVPLVRHNNRSCRINDIDNTCKEAVMLYKNLKRSTYTGFDFEFEPYSLELPKELN